MIASATRTYRHNIEAHRKSPAPARKALKKSRAPSDIDENDDENNQESELEAPVRKTSGKSQESEESGDSYDFKGNDKDDEEAENEESDVEMEDNELLNDVSLAILMSTIGYLPSLIACHHHASRKERQVIEVRTC
jgi:hypothetical protein